MISNSELNVLNQTCHNTKMAVETIQTVLNKVYDEDLAYDLNCQANRYKELGRKAERKMLEAGVRPKEGSPIEKARRWSSIQVNTLLNTSTKHVADVVIQENTKGIGALMKATYNNKVSGSYANELANELVDFEEKNIEKLKSYQ